MSEKTKTTEPEFGKIRSFLWPIHNFELKKLLPMLFLFFCIAFNYTILRDTKDTLIMTAPKSGAEAIPFLKVYGVLPIALVFMLLYTKLSNVLSKKHLFLAALAPFIVYFALFSTVIYPNREALHPHAFCDWLQTVLPHGLMGLVSIIRNWTYSTFYIMAELWGSVCLSLLFWGFANDITKVNESKRFYTLFGLGANVSLVFAGLFIGWASRPERSIGFNTADTWQMSLHWLTGVVTIASIATIATFLWIHKHVMTDPRFYDVNDQKKLKKSKPKLSTLESVKFILKSKYLGLLTILVVSYGMCINLIEVTWKSQLKLAFPDPNSYSAFMGNFSIATGVVTMLMILFVGGNTIRKMGWRFAALCTPVMILVTGGLFFTFMIFNKNLSGMIAMLGTSPLMLAVIFGMMQNIFSKSAKYSLFDPTKEMAYIPLDQESKVKGKAAIDVVAARMGKSGGSLIQQFMIVSLGSIAAMAPYVGFIIIALVSMWIVSVYALDKRFRKAMADQDAENEKTDSQVVEDLSSANSLKKEPAPAK